MMSSSQHALATIIAIGILEAFNVSTECTEDESMETAGDEDEHEEFDEDEFVAVAVYLLITLLASALCSGEWFRDNGGDPRCIFVAVPTLDLILDRHEDQRPRFAL